MRTNECNIPQAYPKPIPRISLHIATRNQVEAKSSNIRDPYHLASPPGSYEVLRMYQLQHSIADRLDDSDPIFCSKPVVTVLAANIVCCYTSQNLQTLDPHTLYWLSIPDSVSKYD